MAYILCASCASGADPCGRDDGTVFFVMQAVLSLTVFLFEIPTGMLTDRIGYKNTMVLAQGIVVLARGLMALAYLTGSLGLFVVEAVAEGFAACFFVRDTGRVYL